MLTEENKKAFAMLSVLCKAPGFRVLLDNANIELLKEHMEIMKDFEDRENMLMLTLKCLDCGNEVAEVSSHRTGDVVQCKKCSSRFRVERDGQQLVAITDRKPTVGYMYTCLVCEKIFESTRNTNGDILMCDHCSTRHVIMYENEAMRLAEYAKCNHCESMILLDGDFNDVAQCTSCGQAYRVRDLTKRKVGDVCAYCEKVIGKEEGMVVHNKLTYCSGGCKDGDIRLKSIRALVCPHCNSKDEYPKNENDKYICTECQREFDLNNMDQSTYGTFLVCKECHNPMLVDPSVEITTCTTCGRTYKTNTLIKDVPMKFNKGKLRYDLIPPDTFEKLVEAITHGSLKYDDNNWMLVVKENRNDYIGSMFRHIEKYRMGVKSDEDSGLHPLAHAMCCMMFLLWEDTQEKGKDDPNLSK